MSTKSKSGSEQPLPPDPAIVPTREYDVLQAAYDHFNRELFEGKLARPMFTLRRGQKRLGLSYQGYFSRNRFRSRTGEESVHEIALNPDHFREVEDEDILSTLVHEMVHLWQREFGVETPSNPHNSEWADKMESIGLLPTSTGRPGGTRTGRKVTHCVISGRLFQKSVKRFLEHNKLSWQDKWNVGLPHDQVTERSAKRKWRMTFQCPRCGQKVETQAAFSLICGYCDRVMDRILAVTGEQAPPVLCIAMATRRSDHAMAARLYQYCYEIHRRNAMQMYLIAEGVATGIPDGDGSGWELRKQAAEWILASLKTKGRGDQLRLFRELLAGEDVRAALEVVLPALNLDGGKEPDASLLREMSVHEDARAREAASHLQQFSEIQTN